MARPEPKSCRAALPRYVLAIAGDLGSCVAESEKSGEETSLLDELDCPVGDDLLVAVRKTYSLTYSRKSSLGQIKKTVLRMRELLSSALHPLAEVTDAMKLKPVGHDKSWDEADDVRVFKFVLASVKELEVKVEVEHEGGIRRCLLLDQIKTQPADPLLIAARDLVSLTFQEVFSPLEHRRLLGEIRRRAAEVLVPFNWCLESIDVEPVAIPTNLGFESLEADLAERADGAAG